MTDLTQILQRAESGRSEALGEVFCHVYAELRRIASVRLASLRPGQTLTPTVLVHEAYEKLLRAEHLNFQNRQHFFACAAQAMRQIAIDYARMQGSNKRGGDLQRTQLEDVPGQAIDQACLLDIDRALEHLAEIDAELLQLVELRFFAGLSLDEIAELWESSRRTLNRKWLRARLLLHGLLSEDGKVLEA